MGASVCKTIRAMLSGDCPKISRGLKLDSIPSWQAYIDPFSGRCYMIFDKYFMIFHTYFMIFEKYPQVYFFTISVFIVWGPSSINRLVPSALFTILSNKILPLEKLTYHHFEEERNKYFRRRTRSLKAYIWFV